MTQLCVVFVDYVVDPAKPGRSGLSDVVWDMAGELQRAGHRACVVASYSTKEYPEPGVAVEPLRLPRWIYRNLVTQVFLVWCACRAVRKLRPDVVHVPEYVSSALLSVWLPGVPVVLTVPGNIYHRLRVADGHSYEWWYVQALKVAARISAKRCARVIAISQEMRTSWMRTGAKEGRIACIPIGASPRRFHCCPEAREQLGLADVGTLLVFVGRFAREKGLLDLLAGAVAARDTLQNKRAKIVLIGKGPLDQELRASIRHHGLDDVLQTVSWVAPDQLPVWYSAADAVILPSHTEGMSRVIPEAFLCGAPIIGTPISGTVDHVVPGRTGLLFPVGDVAALARILEDVAQDPVPLRRMRPAVGDYARSHLTWSLVTRRLTEEVYREVVKRPWRADAAREPTPQGVDVAASGHEASGPHA